MLCKVLAPYKSHASYNTQRLSSLALKFLYVNLAHCSEKIFCSKTFILKCDWSWNVISTKINCSYRQKNNKIIPNDKKNPKKQKQKQNKNKTKQNKTKQNKTKTQNTPQIIKIVNIKHYFSHQKVQITRFVYICVIYTLSGWLTTFIYVYRYIKTKQKATKSRVFYVSFPTE